MTFHSLSSCLCSGQPWVSRIVRGSLPAFPWHQTGKGNRRLVALMLSVNSSWSSLNPGLANSHSKLHCDIVRVDTCIHLLHAFAEFYDDSFTDPRREFQARMMEKALRSVKEKGSQ